MPRSSSTLRRAMLAVLLVVLGPAAAADMVLDRSILVFNADAAGRQDVEVTNTGDDKLYLDTQILDVTDPGTPQEERVPLDDPDAAGVLVTPARMVIPPGGRQLVRIVLLDDPGKVDRIYRINLTPVVPPLQSDTTAVKVVVAYQLLVIVRPEHPAPDLVWTRNGRSITFQNNGNTNVLLYGGTQCPPDDDDPSHCRDLNVAQRLYAGNRWTLDLPFDAPVEFTTTVGLENVRRRFE